MAVWQFKVSLVPRLGVVREYGEIPSVLEEFTPPKDDSGDYLEREFPNYWSGTSLSSENLRSIESILPPMESWSKDAKMFGFEDGHKIELWEDGIDVKVDMRDFDPDYLQRVVDFAAAQDCLVVLNEDGRVVPPSYSDVIEACKQSRACRFVCDPKGTIPDFEKKRREPK